MSLESRLEENILILKMTNPPVNSLSLEARHELFTAFTRDAEDPNVAAIVLSGSGKYFCAGGDLREMGTAAADAEPRLSAHILPAIENCSKPVVAAIHGGAIGGGFEMALACHYRIALASARIALPEITHGIIPLSGTIRLPRLWGVEPALTLMLNSATQCAGDFEGSEVFDRIIPCRVVDPGEQRDLLCAAALEFARKWVIDVASHERHARRLVRHRPRADAEPKRALAKALQRQSLGTATSAQLGVIAAVQAGIELSSFDDALREAQRIYDGLLKSLPKRASSTGCIYN